ncbi:MAG: DNA-directed RNA polymerase subunit beta' [Dehalococcoidia bacterium]|nr:MAG: DNA-directed RNA polymerase subunit beta' [Dehalococcoidia bacterium]
MNDFNAIRISLASPEQIRSWSYGQVTKPETINYRTLKPEKDGLFCEKIFGPTKDFECYCGKYKRVRYKGIICDKCGVEVARSKVRRERMGHIELASPVAHIWFVKGLPSRVGLLLDMSPRSLERVLYFAQFIVTAVNEAARDKAIEALRQEMETQAAEREAQYAEKIALRETALEEAVAQVQSQRDQQLTRLDEELTRELEALKKKVTSLKTAITKGQGKPAPKDLALAETVIVAKGKKVTGQTPQRLQTEADKQVADLEDLFAQRRSESELLADAHIQQLQDAARVEIEPLRQKMHDERQAVGEEYRLKIEELEELKDPIRDDAVTLLMEAKHQELTEAYPDVFSAGMGAGAILDILQRLDLDRLVVKLRQEIQSFSGQRRKKATKRLKVVEAFRKSNNRPEWMVVAVLPVLPPDLRPMVQLDGGRFATSDLNDLYRRVINRNNRLKRLLELGAPEIIIRNEKRMLQEAVDSLIDNGRRGRAVSTAGNHKLKSLSDMLKGKQGRFRQNLLGKRVDYSGRSVIVVGPELKLHQCGLPRRMALELFKPFVMQALVERGLAHNIKSAKRVVERARPEVWDILDEIIQERPVLLNRAPTLHRLGIQSFEPVLVDGSAIRIHPLVCAAFNADFDGDQMAVHIPLSRAAVAEARQIMLSAQNLLLPSSGEPTVAPTLDIVLGCYYLTLVKPRAKGEYRPGTPPRGVYGSFQEVKLAYDLGLVELQAKIKVRDRRTGGELIDTSVGRIIFNEVLPEELALRNDVLDKKDLKDLVAECYHKLGMERTAEMVDAIKNVGFHYATQSGMTIAINDLKVPADKATLLEAADTRIGEVEQQYQMGLITEDERYDQAVGIWRETTERVQAAIQNEMQRYGGVYLMAVSGAKGNISQISQMSGMRGLMTDPSGRIIDLPIRSSFREGLTVLEYFISTHGARKGLADTALRTADSGYLTRRLIDVSQEVIILEDDCGTTAGSWLSESTEKGVLESLRERITGRWAASDLIDPQTGELIVRRNEVINEEVAERIEALGIQRVHVRSPLTCQAKRGLCALCYGRSLARGDLVEVGEAVGIVAAQSIGEPGTQLTMRTFHTGGVAGVDITSGLPRVEELFEARVPKGASLISEIDGTAEIVREGDSRRIKLVSSELYRDEYALPEGTEVVVEHEEWVERGALLARPAQPAKVKKGKKSALPVAADDITARMAGRVVLGRSDRLSIIYEEREEREYIVPPTARIRVETGQYVHAGQQLTDGAVNPQDILRVQGPEAVQLYLVEEIQKVYRSQGVNINDKHIEVIVRQMLRRVQVDSPGDSDLLPGELVDRFRFEEVNAKVLAEGGEPATAQPVLLGVTKASLNTDSFLAAASFQETTRILTEAAVNGAVDHLLGLKENVIIGKLIPARARVTVPERRTVAELMAPSGLLAGGEGEPEEGELAGEVAQGLARLSSLTAAFQAPPGEEGPVEGSGEEPSEESAEEPSEESAEEPGEGLAEEPGEELAEEPSEEPSEESAEEPGEESADEPTEEPDSE